MQQFLNGSFGQQGYGGGYGAFPTGPAQHQQQTQPYSRDPQFPPHSGGYPYNGGGGNQTAFHDPYAYQGPPAAGNARGGGNGSQANGSGSGRSRGGKKKGKKGAPPPNPKKNINKRVRAFIESGSVDAALNEYVEALGNYERNDLQLEVSQHLLLACCKQNRLEHSHLVTEYVHSRGWQITLNEFVIMLTTISQRVRSDVAMRFHSDVSGIVKFDSPQSRAHFLYFSRLLFMEFFTEATQILERVQRRMIYDEKEMLSQVRLQTTGKGGQYLLFKDGYDPRDGDGLGYMAGSWGKGDCLLVCPPDGGEPMEAEVVTAGPFTIKLLTVSSQAVRDFSAFVFDAYKLGNRVAYKRQVLALQAVATPSTASGKNARNFAMDPSLQRALLLGMEEGEQHIEQQYVAKVCKEPAFDRNRCESVERMARGAAQREGMNQSQMEAMVAAGTRRLTLIQGPPGTGKTTVALQVIRIWLQSGVRPILAAADSNTAVDNLVEGLARLNVRVVRAGRAENVRPELQQFTLDFCCASNAGYRVSKEQEYERQMSELRRADVICATCSGAGSETLERLKFPGVIVDEAAQATEPSVLVPITQGAQRVALVGDHFQLAATVKSREAETQGLSRSLFTRLAAQGVEPMLLNIQYRMHPAIAHFPCQGIYSGRVRSMVDPSQRPAPPGFEWPQPRWPVAFVKLPGREESDGTSYVNRPEAARVGQIIAELVAGGVHPDCIGCVSPYAAQVNLLRKILEDYGVRERGYDGTSAGVEVSSVDAFQGREKEVIVFSAVRSNQNRSVGFLADWQRVNVMLTRARRGLVIVGDYATLSSEPTIWRPWIMWVKEAGLIVDEPARTLHAELPAPQNLGNLVGQRGLSTEAEYVQQQFNELAAGDYTASQLGMGRHDPGQVFSSSGVSSSSMSAIHQYQAPEEGTFKSAWDDDDVPDAPVTTPAQMKAETAAVKMDPSSSRFTSAKDGKSSVPLGADRAAHDTRSTTAVIPAAMQAHIQQAVKAHMAKLLAQNGASQSHGSTLATVPTSQPPPPATPPPVQPPPPPTPYEQPPPPPQEKPSSSSNSGSRRRGKSTASGSDSSQTPKEGRRPNHRGGRRSGKGGSAPYVPPGAHDASANPARGKSTAPIANGALPPQRQHSGSLPMRRGPGSDDNLTRGLRRRSRSRSPVGERK
eukprot:scaffold906_cov395-Prasinococcus_capsulatus_cf.AAC.11